MKTFRFLCVLFFSVLIIPLSLMAETAEEKGLRFAEQVDALPVIERMLSQMTLHIYDSQGSKLFSKKSRMAAFTENYNNVDKRLARSLAYFYAPADDKGNSSMVIERKDKDDDQWLYLKGLRKPKRVVGSDKSSSFMGSDFSNGDVAARDIDDYNFKWLASEKIKFKKKTLSVEKIENQFKEIQKREDYGYSKTINWIHVKSGMMFKAEFYNMSGQLFKQLTLRSFVVKKNRDGKKVYIPTQLVMKNMLKGTKTVMSLSAKSIKVEKAARSIKPGIFKVDYLTRKWW